MTIQHRNNVYTLNRSTKGGYWVVTQYTPAGRKTRHRTTDERMVAGLFRPENRNHHAEAKRALAFMFSTVRKGLLDSRRAYYGR